MSHGGLEGKSKKGTYLLRSQPAFTRRGAGGGAFGKKQVERAKTHPLRRRFKPWFGTQLPEHEAGRIGTCPLGSQAIQKWCSVDALVVPPTGNFFQLTV